MKLCLLILSLIVSPLIHAQCVATGPNQALATTNNSGVGTFSWSNLSASQISDNAHATAGQLVGVLATVNSNYIVLSDFGFNIPSTATICGIFVEIEASCLGLAIGASARDNSVRLLVSGAVAGTDHASGTNWLGSDVVSSYGNGSDTWGATLTPAIVNSTNFGVAISTRLSAGLAALFLTARIDNVQMTVYYDNSIIPVTLKSFDAKENSGGVKLNWTTATESGNKTFEIERSSDNVKWTHIASVAGAGHSYVDRHYEYIDKSPNDVNYYRLKQIDLDNNYKLSKIVVVKMSKASAVTLFPNPSSVVLTVRSPQQIREIRFVDVNGMEVFPPRMNSHLNAQNFNVKQLQRGVYFLQVYFQDGTSRKSMFVCR